jgi:RsiW-degrading membrane proteinase PrsW (M82 family)
VRSRWFPAAAVWYFYSRDLNPEPRGVLLTTFFLGALIVIPVIAVAFSRCSSSCRFSPSATA